MRTPWCIGALAIGGLNVAMIIESAFTTAGDKQGRMARGPRRGIMPSIKACPRSREGTH